uniref:Formin-like protein 3 n=1 Tax=Petromyzon marinus TaxID=7757 RepID=A0AAJ7U1T2_PETMA|nr:formin-like protein 3 [Petromyzon marinus]
MDFMRTGRLDTWQAHATARALGLSGISSKASTPPPIIFPPFPLPLHTPLSPPPPPPPPPPLPHGPPPVQRRRCFRFPRPRWDSDDCNDDDDDDDDDDDNGGGGGGWGIVKRSRPGLPSPSLVPMHHVWVLNNSESYGDLSAFALRHPPPPPPPLLLAPPRIPVASPESSQAIGTATVASRILQQQQQVMGL